MGEYKKNYVCLVMTPVGLEPHSALLTGSYTNVSIAINKVEVEEYEAGFNDSGNDFKKISFD